MRVRFFVRFLALFFFWVSTTAQGATVESPCTEAALLKVMPGGEDYDGVVNFACDQSDNIIIVNQEIVLDSDLEIDGSNQAGNGEQISLQGEPDSGRCFVDGYRLFMIPSNVEVKLRDIAIKYFYATDHDAETFVDQDNGGAILNLGKLALERVTMHGSGAQGAGGSIYTSGDLDIQDSRFGILDSDLCSPLGVPPPRAGAIARFGGAIAVLDTLDRGATVDISDTSFYYHWDDQSDAAAGSTLYLESRYGHPVNVTVVLSKITESVSGQSAIHVVGPSASLAFVESSIEDGYGGIVSVGADLTIRNSAFIKNRAYNAFIVSRPYLLSESGEWVGGAVQIVNSTIVGNYGYFDGVADFGGAGVLAIDPSLSSSPKPSISLINSTVARNTSVQFDRDENSDEWDYPVRGINVAADGGVVHIANSIIAEAWVVTRNSDGIADGEGGDANCGVSGFGYVTHPEIYVSGMNLDSDGSCIASAGSVSEFVDQQATPANFASSLELNGGRTPTLALLVESKAIDAADSTICSDPTTVNGEDQRGAPRPDSDGAGFRCDIGAFEYASTPGATAPPTPSPTIEPSPEPSATPTPTPTPSPTATSTPTPVPTTVPTPSPTSSPTPTASPEPSVTPTPTATPTVSPAVTPDVTPSTSSPSPTSTPSEAESTGSGSFDWWMLVLAVIGLCRIPVRMAASKPGVSGS